MVTINVVVQLTCIIWISSEVILSFFKRAKNRAKDFDKSNSLLVWIINILSIIIGINVAAYSENSGIGYIPLGAALPGYLGLLLMLSGIAVRWTAIHTLGQHFTTTLAIVEDHKIIEKGPYKYIRHPSYTGALLSFLGLSITFSNWITLLIIFFPILLSYLYRIKIEEKLLVSHFGEEYAIYAGKTARLIPKIY